MPLNNWYNIKKNGAHNSNFFAHDRKKVEKESKCFSYNKQSWHSDFTGVFVLRKREKKVQVEKPFPQIYRLFWQ